MKKYPSGQSSSSKTILWSNERNRKGWRLKRTLSMQASISHPLRCHAVQSEMTRHDWTDQKTSVFRALKTRSAVDRSRPALCPGGRETSGGLRHEWLPGNKVKVMEQVKNQLTIDHLQFLNVTRSEVIIHSVILIRCTFRWYISCSFGRSFKGEPKGTTWFPQELATQ